MEENGTVIWGEKVFSEEDIRTERWTDVCPSDYVGLKVSSLGRVKKLRNGIWKLTNPSISKTTKGHYYVVSASQRLVDGSGEAKSPSIHRLVLKSFGEPPPSDGKKYEVNHIDGDKINNRIENLEWITRSQNVKHAFNTGLNVHAIRVKRTDMCTGKVKEYVSVLECARDNGIKHHQVKWWSYRRDGELYRGRFRFELFRAGSKVPIHPITKVVVGKDYVSGNSYVCNTAGELGHLLGVSEYTVSRYSRMKRRDLVNGCVVMLKQDFDVWPEYTEEEARESREKYQAKSHGKLKEEPIYVTDFYSGDRFVVERFVEIVRLVGGKRAMKRNGHVLSSVLSAAASKYGLFWYGQYFFSTNGFVCLDDSEPEMIRCLIKNSMVGFARGAEIERLVRILQLESDVAEYFISLSEFGRSHEPSLHPEKIVRFLETNEGKKKYRCETINPFSVLTIDPVCSSGD